MRARQGTDTYLSGSPSRRAALRAHANTERLPPSARVASAAALARLNIGRLDGNERLGGADDRASTAGKRRPPHRSSRCYRRPRSRPRRTLRCICDDEWRLRTATQRFSTTRTDLPPQRLGNIGYVRKVRHFGITAFRGPPPAARRHPLDGEPSPPSPCLRAHAAHRACSR